MSFAKTEEEVFEWLKIKEEIGSEDDVLHQETGMEKLRRKCKENPFVPIGALATAGCLSYGLYSFKQGDRRLSQLMMRARVVAQGFTVLALVGGVWAAARKTRLATSQSD